MTTLAPFARHWSACERCFWASPSALLIDVGDLRLLERRDERRPVLRLPADRRLRVGQQDADSAVAAVDFALPANAAPTERPTASAPTRSATMNFFTRALLVHSMPPARTLLRPARVQTRLESPQRRPIATSFPRRAAPAVGADASPRPQAPPRPPRARRARDGATARRRHGRRPRRRTPRAGR